MLTIRHLSRSALILAVASACVAPASAGPLARMIQKRRAEYQLHKQVGAGPVVAAVPGKAGLRGAVLQQKAGAGLRQRFQKKKDAEAIRTALESASSTNK